MGLRTYMQTAKIQASLPSAEFRYKLCCLPQVLSRCTACDCKQQRFRQDCTDAQARLKLCCLRMSEGPFSHGAAHLYSRCYGTFCANLKCIDDVINEPRLEKMGLSDVCKQQSFRRACTSAPSRQKLCYLLKLSSKPTIY